jgi:hypothetical protein
LIGAIIQALKPARRSPADSIDHPIRCSEGSLTPGKEKLARVSGAKWEYRNDGGHLVSAVTIKFASQFSNSKVSAIQLTSHVQSYLIESLLHSLQQIFRLGSFSGIPRRGTLQNQA